MGGSDNMMSGASQSSIVGGRNNQLTNNSNHSSIVGGQNNQLTYNSHFSSIIGGYNNQLKNYSRYSSIVGGYYNQLTNNSHFSSIVGGCNNQLTCSIRSVIIGGQNLSLIDENDTVLVPSLKIANMPTSPGQPGILYYDAMTGQVFVSIVPSDIRLKNIIEKIGQSKNGVNIYKFTYKSDKSNTVYQGVIAQELIGTKYENALHMENGFYKVDYSKIGIQFKTI